MSGSLNKAAIIGDLAKDPFAHSKTGARRRISLLPQSESWEDQTVGDRKQRVDWHRIRL
jgi:single-strand DNA-binding protein